MKKILASVLIFMLIFTLFGCKQVKDKVEEIKGQMEPDREKIEDTRGILDKVLKHIADTDPELSFKDGTLLDSELGVPHFDVVPISEIKHFNKKDVVDGFIVRPVVDVDNPKLLIVVEAVDKSASESLKKAMAKVHSDQYEKFKDAGIMTRYLVSNNKTVRQGNFLIYVTWEDTQDIVKVFERHVR